MNYIKLFLLLLLSAVGLNAYADYSLGSGDLVRISVYGNQDLTLETRIDEVGQITYPLIGQVQLGGLSTKDAESRIAVALKKGGFIQEPNVNVFVVEALSKLTSVLGSVNKPGRFPVNHKTTLLDLIADAGGLAADGSDLVTIVKDNNKKTFDIKKLIEDNTDQSPLLVGGETVYVGSHNVLISGEVNRPGKFSIVGSLRTVADFVTVAGGWTQSAADFLFYTTNVNGEEITQQIDIASLMTDKLDEEKLYVKPGDKIYIPKASMVYIYGEVQRPGSYRIEKNMTVMQALAQGGGTTARGTQRGIKIYRTNKAGEVVKVTATLTDFVQKDDVLFVEESLF